MPVVSLVVLGPELGIGDIPRLDPMVSALPRLNVETSLP